MYFPYSQPQEGGFILPTAQVRQLMELQLHDLHFTSQIEQLCEIES